MSQDHPDPGDPPSCSSGDRDPQFKKEFEETIQAWADATNAGKTEEAQNVAMQLLMMVGEDALRNPTPSLLLKQEADDLETKGDWTAAEAVRRKILDLEESSGNFGMIAKAQMDLCLLLRLFGRLDEAGHFASAASLSARRSDVIPLVVMVLECEALCALDQGDSSKALAVASEALQIIEPGKLYDRLRARALTTRARCLIANSDLTGAELHLLLSWKLLPAESNSCMMPGTIQTLANWWEVKSQLEERRENLESACSAITRTIEFRRQSESPHARFVLTRALARLGEISSVAADLAGAEQARNEAKTIREELHVPPGRKAV